MTSIHAPVPEDLNGAVAEARFRGEEVDVNSSSFLPTEETEHARPSHTRKQTRVQSLRMKKPASEQQQPPPPPPPQRDIPMADTHSTSSDEDDDEDDENTASKENDPSLSPTPVRFTSKGPGPHLTSPKNNHGKRPLSVLSMPLDTNTEDMDMEVDTKHEEEHGLEDIETDTEMTASEKNIAANTTTNPDPRLSSSTRRRLSPHRKSPNPKRPMITTTNGIKSHHHEIGTENDVPIFEDTSAAPPIHQAPSSRSVSPSKSIRSSPKNHSILKSDLVRGSGTTNRVAKYPVGGSGSRKVSSASSKSSSRAKPRIGIRRL